jgi:hypothetical protein
MPQHATATPSSSADYLVNREHGAFLAFHVVTRTDVCGIRYNTAGMTVSAFVVRRVAFLRHCTRRATVTCGIYCALYFPAGRCDKTLRSGFNMQR